MCFAFKCELQVKSDACYARKVEIRIETSGLTFSLERMNKYKSAFQQMIVQFDLFENVSFLE